MRTLSGGMIAMLASGSSTLAKIFTITRRDGVVKRFTDHDRDITMPGPLLFQSSNSVLLSAISSTATTGIQNADAKIVFGPADVTEADVVRGLYDTASVEVAFVNWANPSHGKIVIMTGVIGTSLVTNKLLGTFEFEGLLNRADARIGEIYSPECRADLGDNRCKVALATFTKTGIVNTVVNASKVNVTFSEDVTNGFFSFGVVTFTSGLNSGISMELINQFALVSPVGQDQITFALGLPNQIQPGDTFNIVAGCDKRAETCKTKFANFDNFRGEPNVPGDDLVNDRPTYDS